MACLMVVATLPFALLASAGRGYLCLWAAVLTLIVTKVVASGIWRVLSLGRAGPLYQGWSPEAVAITGS